MVNLTLSVPVPSLSFPSFAWERLRRSSASNHSRMLPRGIIEAELRYLCSQAELGNKDKDMDTARVKCIP